MGAQWTAVPVMVLNWNGWDDTLRCLASLRDAPDVEVVWLVDNGSETSRVAEASSTYPGLRVLLHSRNLGFSGGYNRALRLAAREGHRHAYLLNNDCIVHPAFLQAAIAAASAAAQDPSPVAAIGSCILYPAVNPDEGEYVLFDGQYHLPATARRAPFDVRDATELNGAGMLVSLEAMDACGYFDERFFCYGEETEWCWRVRDHGWRVVVAGRSMVTHRREGSDANGNAQYYRTRNRFLLLERLGRLQRWVWRLRHSMEAARALAAAEAEGVQDSARAIADGVHDGLFGRFGQRRPNGHSEWTLTGLRAWNLLARRPRKRL